MNYCSHIHNSYNILTHSFLHRKECIITHKKVYLYRKNSHSKYNRKSIIYNISGCLFLQTAADVI